jgi:hypothetical protein
MPASLPCLLPRYTRAAGLLLLLTGAAQAASVNEAMPTPGLYQIDTDGTISTPTLRQGDITRRMQTDGDTGASTATTTVPGQPVSTQHYAAGKPQTFCMKPMTAVVPPPVAGCVSAPGKLIDGAVVMENHCGYLDATTTIRKLDDKTWEYTTKTVQHRQDQARAVQDNAAGMRMMLENMAKNAATAEEREQARKGLAQLPAMTAALNQSAARTPPSMALPGGIDPARAGARGVMESTSVQRWTRISQQCTGEKR